MLQSYVNLFVRFLNRSWDEVNRHYLGGALHPPVFRISESATTLGTWRLHERTLSISGALLLQRSQLEVLEVLKHEMAHQYADEVLAATQAGETAHGSGFRHACRLLGIHHSARMNPQSEPSPILSRIRKLLALAESHNEHEAALAMSRAKELMEKYELELADEEQEFRYGFLGKPRKQRAAVEQIIASILVRHFHVRVIWIPSQFIVAERKVWLMELSGTTTNMEVATYVYEYLMRELEYLWLTHRRRNPRSKGKTMKREYQLGVLQGFGQKLEETQVAEAVGSELIQLKTARLLDFFHSRHPNTRRGRRLSYRESDSYKAGFAKGKELEIRKGVKKGRSSRVLDKNRLLN